MDINNQVKISFDGDRILLSQAFSEMREGRVVYYDLIVHSKKPLNKEAIDLARKIQSVWLDGLYSLQSTNPEAKLSRMEIVSNKRAHAKGELADQIGQLDHVDSIKTLYNEVLEDNPLKGRVTKGSPNPSLTKKVRKTWKFFDYAISIGSDGVSLVRNSMEVFGRSIRIMAIAGGILSALGSVVSFVCSGYEMARSFYSRNIELATQGALGVSASLMRIIDAVQVAVKASGIAIGSIAFYVLSIARSFYKLRYLCAFRKEIDKKGIASLQELAPFEKKTKKWQQLKSRIGRDCAEKIRAELPQLLEGIANQDEGSIAKAASLVEEARFENRKRIITNIAISALFVVGLTVMLFASGPALYASVATIALLSFALDLNRIRNFWTGRLVHALNDQKFNEKNFLEESYSVYCHEGKWNLKKLKRDVVVDLARDFKICLNDEKIHHLPSRSLKEKGESRWNRILKHLDLESLDFSRSNFSENDLTPKQIRALRFLTLLNQGSFASATAHVTNEKDRQVPVLGLNKKRKLLATFDEKQSKLHLESIVQKMKEPENRSSYRFVKTSFDWDGKNGKGSISNELALNTETT